MNNISIVISLLSLTVSGLTFWLTRMKKGTVKMTRPTVIYFGPDGKDQKHNKVFIRTLLYSTSERGQYVQNMFISLQRGESVQNFNVWVYDDKGLVRGSGLFINKSGIACNHHFLLPIDGNYSFLSGSYILKVYIETVDDGPAKIFEQELYLTKEDQVEMLSKDGGIYFDWAPNTQNYFTNVDSYKRR
ncbi:hypothetical protein [Flavobacterium sp. WG21]|uniref:hypothetical protein n=1 Tax=Flavobacterium sp. WG21 TaxID=1229487 RepID=UPI00034C050F|nr:hypothetical protein [Flavobacterium sp. WG21]